MGSVKPLPPVRIFASVMFNEGGLLPELDRRLEPLLGPVLERSEIMAFSFSDYYRKEMGDLSRLFLSFSVLAPRESLVGIKAATNTLEEGMSVKGRRTVNIDPGYVALEHVVLATTKGYSHRLYLGQGIFGDLTLIFRNGGYRPLEWTYPDYACDGTTQMFNRWRQDYKEQLRCLKA